MKIEDKKQLTKLLSFIIMGDGSVYRNRGKGNCLFSINATEDHLDFIEYCQSIVENVTSSKVIYEKRDETRRNQYKLYTPVHPFFNKLRDRIYVGNYKSIDQHILKLLDFEALAILYMSDGCLGKHINKKTGKTSYTTTINLCRLSYGDLLLLKRTIKDKLDIEFNIVKTGGKYHTLRLRAKDHDKFMKGIRPHMCDSFLYKVDFRTDSPSSKEGGDIV